MSADDGYKPSETVLFRFDRRPPDEALVALFDRMTVAALDDEVRWASTGCNLYRPFEGTGTILVDDIDGWMKVIASWECDVDDVLLAVAIAADLAKQARVATVVQEGYGPVAVDDLVRLYDRTWAEARVAWAMLTRADRARELTGSPLALYGPNRIFELGPRTLARLDASDEAGFPARLLAAMRQLQWPNSHIASELHVSSPSAAVGPREWVAVVRHSANGSLMRSDGVALVLDDAGDVPRLVRMPMEDLLARLEGRVHPIDEHHVFLEPLDDATWASLLTSPELPEVPSPAPGRRTGDCWVWIIDGDTTYLAFEFFEAGRGMKARGDRVSSPPTATEVQAAVERPSHTFPTDAGIVGVRDLTVDEQIDLGLPVAPPWAE